MLRQKCATIVYVMVKNEESLLALYRRMCMALRGNVMNFFDNCGEGMGMQKNILW